MELENVRCRVEGCFFVNEKCSKQVRALMRTNSCFGVPCYAAGKKFLKVWEL